MQIKTTDLTGRALDWAVGVAISLDGSIEIENGVPGYSYTDVSDCGARKVFEPFEPTTNWGQLGPYTKLISWVQSGQVFSICLYDPDSKRVGERSSSLKGCGNADHEDFQIALCRAIVDLYLGDQVDVPEVLCQSK